VFKERPAFMCTTGSEYNLAHASAIIDKYHKNKAIAHADQAEYLSQAFAAQAVVGWRTVGFENGGHF